MYRFITEESTLSHRSGRAVTVLETRKEPTETDADSAIHRIRFADGFEAIAFAEELVEFTATGNRPYRDTL